MPLPNKKETIIADYPRPDEQMSEVLSEPRTTIPPLAEDWLKQQLKSVGVELKSLQDNGALSFRKDDNEGNMPTFVITINTEKIDNKKGGLAANILSLGKSLKSKRINVYLDPANPSNIVIAGNLRNMHPKPETKDSMSPATPKGIRNGYGC